MSDYYNGPIWDSFGLSYASYAVFPRRALQSMPADWQQKFVDLINEAHEALEDGVFSGDYTVLLRVNGRIAKDPMQQYRHAGPVGVKEPA